MSARSGFGRLGGRAALQRPGAREEPGDQDRQGRGPEGRTPVTHCVHSITGRLLASLSREFQRPGVGFSGTCRPEKDAFRAELALSFSGWPARSRLLGQEPAPLPPRTRSAVPATPTGRPTSRRRASGGRAEEVRLRRVRLDGLRDCIRMDSLLYPAFDFEALLDPHGAREAHARLGRGRGARRASTGSARRRRSSSRAGGPARLPDAEGFTRSAGLLPARPQGPRPPTARSPERSKRRTSRSSGRRGAGDRPRALPARAIPTAPPRG